MAWSKDSIVKSVIMEFFDSFESVVRSNSRVGYLTIYLAEWNELILVTGWGGYLSLEDYFLINGWPDSSHA